MIGKFFRQNPHLLYLDFLIKYMQIEKIQWIDSCEYCGIVVNSKVVFEKENKCSTAEGYYNDFGYLSWTCPNCKKNNNLNKNNNIKICH